MLDYPISPVSFTNVKINDPFWKPRIDINRNETIPYAFRQCEDNHRIENFENAAKSLAGEKGFKFQGGYPFDDTDVYKIIEGASFCLAVEYDEKLDHYLDTLIEKIAAAQEPDGYLYTARTIDPDHPHEWAMGGRWVKTPEHSHELYNLGHLYEAAVVHFEATGKRSLLEIALKSAELLLKDFGWGKVEKEPGHQIIEMGLCQLYRVTGDQKYLRLARFFLEVRGKKAGKAYFQRHLPVLEQKEAVGHAVRATYMYSGMADIAALSGDKKYLKAIDTLWENVVTKKLAVTGGIGATHDGESFDKNYILPNATCYNETCAAIANVYWNHRLFLLHGHTKYLDILELCLYNGIAASVSLSGKEFFYVNPLEWDGKWNFNRHTQGRQPWFECSCCPSNLTRFLASIARYAYAVKENSIFVNLYAAGTAEIEIDGQTIHITQETNYPWDGKIKLTIDSETPDILSLKFRIPGWSQGRPVPSELYRFLALSSESPSLLINGTKADLSIQDGFATISREWKNGDEISLNFPMPIQKVITDDKVETNTGLIAFQRGPLIFCAEEVDHTSSVLKIEISKEDEFVTEQTNDLGGVVILKSTNRQEQMTLIPYHAWNNRGNGEMAVFFKYHP
jgi:DUF1680 family protein